MSDKAKQVLAMFQRYDGNGDGVIDRFELAEVLTELDNKWTGDRIHSLFAALDTDDDGKVEMDEFVAWVFGNNAVAAHIMDEKPFMVLRLNGFGHRSRQELADTLKSLGSVAELHHVKGNAKESIVLYSSEEDARNAFEALGGTFDPEQLRAEGEFRASCKSGSPLYRKGEADSDTEQVICLTPKVYSEPGAQVCPGGFVEELSAFVKQHEVAFGDDYGKWCIQVEKMCGGSPTLCDAAKQLRLMSLNVQIKAGQQDNTAMWRRTMRLLARGELELKDPSKMSDMLHELDSFVSDTYRPKSAAQERATKKAKVMGIDNPWHVLTGIHDNSAVTTLTLDY